MTKNFNSRRKEQARTQGRGCDAENTDCFQSRHQKSAQEGNPSRNNNLRGGAGGSFRQRDNFGQKPQ